jgi:hypothetical protein
LTNGDMYNTHIDGPTCMLYRLQLKTMATP